MKLSLGASILLALLPLCLSDSAPALSHVVRVGRNGREVLHSQDGKDGVRARLGRKVLKKGKRNILTQPNLIHRSVAPQLVSHFNHAPLSLPAPQVFSAHPVHQHFIHKSTPTFHQAPIDFSHHHVPHAPSNLFQFSHHGPAIDTGLAHFSQHVAPLVVAPVQHAQQFFQQVHHPAPIAPALPIAPFVVPAPIVAPAPFIPAPAPVVAPAPFIPAPAPFIPAPASFPEVIVARTEFATPLTLEYASPQDLYNAPAPVPAPAVEAVRSYLSPAPAPAPAVEAVRSYLSPAPVPAPAPAVEAVRSYLSPAPVPVPAPAVEAVRSYLGPVEPVVEKIADSYLAVPEPVQERAPTDSYLEPAVATAPEPVVAVAPRQSYIQPVVAVAPRQSYIQPAPQPVVVVAPRDSYIPSAPEPVVVRAPVSSYLEPAEPVVVRAPVSSYLEPAVAVAPRDSYIVAQPSAPVSVVKSNVLAATRVEPIAIIRSVLNAPDSKLAVKDGWDYSYESANGIKQEATGSLRLIDDSEVSVMKGSYEFLGVDNVLYTVQWFADETGFHATAPHLPQSVLPNHPEVAAAVKAQIAFAEAEDLAALSSGVVKARGPAPSYQALPSYQK